MSAAFVEFAVKLDVLQSAIMHVCAECGYCDVEKVSDKENRHAKDISDCNHARALREESEYNLTYLIDDERNDAARKSETEQTRVRKNIRKNIHAVVQFCKSAEKSEDFLCAFLAANI